MGTWILRTARPPDRLDRHGVMCTCQLISIDHVYKMSHWSPKLYHKSFQFFRHRSLSLKKPWKNAGSIKMTHPYQLLNKPTPRYISKYSIVLASHFRSLILQITHVHPNLPNTKHVQWTCLFFVSTRLSWAKWIQKDEEQRETDRAQEAIWSI